MKQYLIVDLMSENVALEDYKGVKDLLIEQISNDLKTNLNEPTLKTSMLNNINVLERLAREKDTPISYIKSQLKEYSWKIIDLIDLQRDLEDVKIYFNKYIRDFDFVIDKINKGVNENE